MGEPIILYYSSVSSCLQMKKKQERIVTVLTGKKIPFTMIDISVEEGGKEKMRDMCGDPKALPPQLCRGDCYIGDYESFDMALEDQDLEGFLNKQGPTPQTDENNGISDCQDQEG